MQRFETKYDLLNKAYKDDNINKGTLTLFQYLVHKSDKKGCFPKVDTIASALGCCRRTVQYNMRKLEKAGYIIRKDRWYNHQQLSNMYSFNVGVVDEKDNIIYESKKKITEYLSGDLCSDKKDKGFKSAGIKRIYKSKMSSYEKLLLIYCYHKADSKGIMYRCVDDFCRALGINERTLKRLLGKMRRNNLIMVRYCRISGKSVYVIMITDNIKHEGLSKESWKENWPENNFAKNLQRNDADHKVNNADHNSNVVNNLQTDIIDDRQKHFLNGGFDEHVCPERKISKQKHIQYFIEVLKKGKNAVLNGINNIRKILRL